jgi:hypothetical protein
VGYISTTNSFSYILFLQGAPNSLGYISSTDSFSYILFFQGTPNSLGYISSTDSLSYILFIEGTPNSLGYISTTDSLSYILFLQGTLNSLGFIYPLPILLAIYYSSKALPFPCTIYIYIHYGFSKLHNIPPRHSQFPGLYISTTDSLSYILFLQGSPISLGYISTTDYISYILFLQGTPNSLGYTYPLPILLATYYSSKALPIPCAIYIHYRLS